MGHDRPIAVGPSQVPEGLDDPGMLGRPEHVGPGDDYPGGRLGDSCPGPLDLVRQRAKRPAMAPWGASAVSLPPSPAMSIRTNPAQWEDSILKAESATRSRFVSMSDIVTSLAPASTAFLMRTPMGE